MPDFLAVCQYGHVGGNDGTNAGSFCRIADIAHLFQVFTVDDGVDGEVGFYALCPAGGGDFAKVGLGKTAGRVGAHI